MTTQPTSDDTISRAFGIEADIEMMDRMKKQSEVRGFTIVCAVLLTVEFAVDRHVSHAWESLWGFYAIYGFVACVALVEIAKLLRALLGRDPDYYEKS